MHKDGLPTGPFLTSWLASANLVVFSQLNHMVNLLVVNNSTTNIQDEVSLCIFHVEDTIPISQIRNWVNDRLGLWRKSFWIKWTENQYMWSANLVDLISESREYELVKVENNNLNIWKSVKSYGRNRLFKLDITIGIVQRGKMETTQWSITWFSSAILVKGAFRNLLPCIELNDE